MRQEWIYSVLTIARADLAEEFYHRALLAPIIIRVLSVNRLCNIEQFVLCDELTNLHFLVQGEETILVTEDAIQQLIEVNEAILRFDSHL